VRTVLLLAAVLALGLVLAASTVGLWLGFMNITPMYFWNNSGLTSRQIRVTVPEARLTVAYHGELRRGQGILRIYRVDSAGPDLWHVDLEPRFADRVEFFLIAGSYRIDIQTVEATGVIEVSYQVIRQ